MDNRAKQAMMRLVDIRRDEWPALGWAAAWFFCVLAAYYAIRPVRETFGVSVGHEELAWWWTATFITMLVMTPLYGLVVGRVPRRWLVLVVYGFFIANLVVFWGLFSQPDLTLTVEVRKVFYVWVSVFILFVVTLFWGSAVDVFHSEQGKRLFGIIAGAGTLGGVFGSRFAGVMARRIEVHELLWAPVVLLSVAIVCAWQLRRYATRQSNSINQIPRSQGWSDAWSGMTHVVRSPYLGGIAALMVLASICGTGVYFQMMDLVREAIPNESDRTVWFARINATQLWLTLFIQTALASWLIRKFGLGITLAIVPLVYLLGFSALWLSPLLGALALFEVSHRVAAFSIGVPAREVLFTLITPDQKYRAKAFIDTVGKRAGDALAAHGYAALRGLGWLPTSVALAVLPIAGVLAVLSLTLGRLTQRRPEQSAVLGKR